MFFNLIGLGIQQLIMIGGKWAFDLSDTDRLELNLVRMGSVAVGTVFLLLTYRTFVFKKGPVEAPVSAELPIPVEFAQRRTSSPSSPPRWRASRSTPTGNSASCSNRMRTRAHRTLEAVILSGTGVPATLFFEDLTARTPVRSRAWSSIDRDEMIAYARAIRSAVVPRRRRRRARPASSAT